MGRQSRRHFLRGSITVAGLSLLSGCGIAAPQTQPPTKVHRIGWLQESASPRAFLETFQEALRGLGYAEGQTLVIEARYGDTVDQLPDLAADLVRLNVDAIAVTATPSARAAKSATSTIPIVFNLVADPVGLGLVDSLARPGGNLTGLSNFNNTLGPKKLELLKELIPALSRVVVLWNATNPAFALQVQTVEEAARALGVEAQVLAVRHPDELEGALEAAVTGRAEALIDITVPFSTRTAQLLAGRRLPSMFQAREHAVAGGLMAYGPNQHDLFRRAAAYVDKILKGRRPADLPVENPTVFNFVINLSTAQAVGLTVPQSVLLQATEVIQ